MVIATNCWKNLLNNSLPKSKNMNLESINCSEKFSINKEICYLFGVYLTDGSINNQGRFTMKVIDKDFSERTLKYLKNLVTDSKSEIYMQKGIDRLWACGRISKCQDQYCLSVKFHEYKDIFEISTGKKHHIPWFIWNADLVLKKWFIAGVMDGDGWISKSKRKQFRGGYQYRIGVGKLEESWILEFKELLHKMRVKTCKTERITEGEGIQRKPMLRFSINTESFANHGLFFTINRKQERLRKYIELRNTRFRSETRRCTS